jgi:hypothetical protein
MFSPHGLWVNSDGPISVIQFLKFYWTGSSFYIQSLYGCTSVSFRRPGAEQLKLTAEHVATP